MGAIRTDFTTWLTAISEKSPKIILKRKRRRKRAEFVACTEPITLKRLLSAPFFPRHHQNGDAERRMDERRQGDVGGKNGRQDSVEEWPIDLALAAQFDAEQVDQPARDPDRPEQQKVEVVAPLHDKARAFTRNGYD